MLQRLCCGVGRYGLPGQTRLSRWLEVGYPACGGIVEALRYGSTLGRGHLGVAKRPIEGVGASLLPPRASVGRIACQIVSETPQGGASDLDNSSWRVTLAGVT